MPNSNEEETKEELNENTENGEESPPQEEYTETEREAMRRGWDPDFEGDENKKALSAEEFLDRQPLYDELHKTKRELRRQREALEALRKHQANISEREYNRAIEDLKRQKKEALENEDHDKVVELDEEMAKHKDEYKAQSEEFNKADNSQTNEAFEEFKTRNTWYQSDPELTQEADAIGIGLANQYTDERGNLTKTPEEIYSMVEDRIKKLFPDKFENPNKKNAAGVESGGRGTRSNKSTKPKWEDLPEEAKEIGQTLIKTGVIKSKDDYAKEYFG